MSSTGTSGGGDKAEVSAVSIEAAEAAWIQNWLAVMGCLGVAASSELSPGRDLVTTRVRFPPVGAAEVLAVLWLLPALFTIEPDDAGVTITRRPGEVTR